MTQLYDLLLGRYPFPLHGGWGIPRKKLTGENVIDSSKRQPQRRLR
ncbi:MAG: hypothetical protein JOZ78_06265 [Chroococcidiopsidaceae cyanobacterium CP_BM_ER_R8_30]|nr:hypothetical protein [Chroococcidiopsidaceae cyanobacterium CP_BM_ER_R8_30]